MNLARSEKLHPAEGSEGHWRLTEGACGGILIIMEDGLVAAETAGPSAILRQAHVGNQIAVWTQPGARGGLTDPSET